MSVKFYICRHCGNVIMKVQDAGVPVICCGEKMEELVPNSVEASSEKHLPVVSLDNGILQVNVGSVDHPMQPEHFIQWVAVETASGVQVKKLSAGNAPHVSFALGDEKAIKVYEYCNLHGLWVTEL